MTEISGVPSFGGGGFAHRAPPAPDKPAVPEVANAATGNKTTDQSQRDPRTTRADDIKSERRIVARLETQEAEKPREKPGPEVIPGPTPAFQATLLEIDSDLKNVIAKIEAARNRDRDGSATAPAGTAQNADKPTDAQALAKPTAVQASDTQQAKPSTNLDDKPENAPEAPALPAQTSAPQDTAKEGESFALETPYDLGATDTTADAA